MQYVVTYLKLRLSKSEIEPRGVYFGGVYDNQEEADTQARHLVNTLKGGTILPKFVIIEGRERLIDAMYCAEQQFEDMLKQMVEANETITDADRKYKARKKRLKELEKSHRKWLVESRAD